VRSADVLQACCGAATFFNLTPHASESAAAA